MIEIINKPIDDKFYNLVADSKSKIRLCAPYVKEQIVNNIYDHKRENVKLDIVSNFNIANFYKHSSDIEAFKTIIKQQNRVFNCQVLHAKIYIFDDKYSIITSSNLTTSGFKKNLEYGVLISDIDLVNKNIADFKSICNDKSTGIIDAKKISNIEKILKGLPKYKNEFYIQNSEIDNILNIDTNLIRANLNGWKKETFDVVESISKMEFSLSDVYSYENIFLRKHPNNNTIKDSIRRNLQELRDLGLIKFCGNGKYKKLYNKNKS